MRYFMPNVTLSHIRPPYSITVICFFLSFSGIVSVRYLWRFYNAFGRKEAELLSRDEKTFDNSIAARFFSGRTVMVTGAGGTIGSEIVRQVAAAGASRILMVERCENALYEIDRDMRSQAKSASLIPLMVDINDATKMTEIFKSENPSVVLHAAAYKHVPMVELNPDEGWRNNTEATRSIAKIALDNGVERFVLISTDKAVNPVSVMGKTKLAAEKAIMELEGATSFCAVRFGNVFGSSGSVVPLFRSQISRREPVTVTHPDMRRYFMTIQEAVSLVLQAASRSEKAIYTLDMGESVNILSLAEGMISQAGYRPYVDIPIVFTGIRPGEKLFEELDISEKSAYRTDMAKIYITKAN
jgi:FlaA1/EpsC-like NDP-sugar epimerase